MSFTWLEIKSNGQGLPGPILEERQVRPWVPDHSQIIAVIGERQSQELYLHRRTNDAVSPRILLDRLEGTNTFVADCTMHRHVEALRVMGGPAPPDISHHSLSKVKIPSNTTMAWKLYAQLLLPFSTAVIVFADDLGGLEDSARCLATWICLSSSSGIRPAPRLIVASQKDCSPKVFQGMLMQHTLGQLNMLSPEGHITLSDVVKRCQLCFDGIYLTRLSPGCSVTDWLVKHSEEVSVSRRQSRQSFTSSQFQRLFQEAVQQFVDNDHFSLVHMYYKLPPSSELHLREMCQLATLHLKDAVLLTASSLAQYCWSGEYKPYFPPEEVFEQCFEGLLTSLQRSLTISGFCDQVQSAFRGMIQSHEAARHVEHVKLSGLDWTAPGSMCVLCMLRARTNILRCMHGLCDICSRSNGRLEYGSWYLVSCPLCEGSDTIHLKPQTAPVRALVLLGGKGNATRNFLRRLTASLYGRLTDYFDIVIGSGNALTLTVDVFAEGRGLDPRPVGSKWLAWRSKTSPRISPLAKNRCRVAVLGKRGILCNYRGALSDQSTPLEFLAQEVERLWPGSRVMTMVHDGSSTSNQTPEYRQSILLTSMNDLQAPNMSDLLVASLFFLEVVDEPGYLFPQECRIRMRCRLSPGHHLFNLIYKLRYRDARVYCRSNSRRWHKHNLCDTRQWDRLKTGAEYGLTWAMEITSFDMQIHVEMDGIVGRNHISDGPVTLKDLSQDLGEGTAAPVGRLESEESGRAVEERGRTISKPISAHEDDRKVSSSSSETLFEANDQAEVVWLKQDRDQLDIARSLVCEEIDQLGTILQDLIDSQREREYF